MDTIRDMLSVGQGRNGDWLISFWGGGEPSVLGHFPREDEAWGVTSLILEYVERHDYPPDRAIWAAMQEYHEAKEEEASSSLWPLDNEPAPTDAAYQDHAHGMATYPN